MWRTPPTARRGQGQNSLSVCVLVCGYVCSVLLQKRVVVRVKIPCVRTRARARVCVSGCVCGVHFQKHVVFRVKMPCVRVVCVFVGMYVRRSPPKTLTNTHHLPRQAFE